MLACITNIKRSVKCKDVKFAPLSVRYGVFSHCVTCCVKICSVSGFAVEISCNKSTKSTTTQHDERPQTDFLMIPFLDLASSRDAQTHTYERKYTQVQCHRPCTDCNRSEVTGS